MIMATPKQAQDGYLSELQGEVRRAKAVYLTTYTTFAYQTKTDLWRTADFEATEEGKRLLDAVLEAQDRVDAYRKELKRR